MNKLIAILLTCVACGWSAATLAAGCNRNEVCPPICVTDDSDACTHTTNISQMCALRVYTCNGCIAATASKLKLPVACVTCVIDALAVKSEVGSCNAICSGAATVESVVKNNGC